MNIKSANKNSAFQKKKVESTKTVWGKSIGWAQPIESEAVSQ
jgi:hypothetical protein